MPSTPDEWVSAGEAARLLGRRTKTLVRYADMGLLRTRRFGDHGRREYLRSSIEQLLEEAQS